MLNFFWDRLQRVIDDRKPFPWAQSIGWNKGTMSKVVKGHVPGPELLVPVSRIENVRLDWLLTGRGTPYFVSRCLTDDEAADLLAAHLEDSHVWTINTLYAPNGAAIVLHEPASLLLKDTEIRYTAVEVITGNLGRRSATVIERAEERGTPQEGREISTTSMDMLTNGQLGTHQLLGPGGLLDAPLGRMNLEEIARADESIVQYAAGTGGNVHITVNGRRLEMAKKIEQLDEDDRSILEQLLARLAPH